MARRIGWHHTTHTQDRTALAKKAPPSRRGERGFKFYLQWAVAVLMSARDETTPTLQAEQAGRAFGRVRAQASLIGP